MYEESSKEIKEVLNLYFKGIYEGDLNKLKRVFDPNTLLFGDIKGQLYFKNLPDYLEGVKDRESPSELGEAFRMKIISIEISGNIASAKLHVPMFEYNYYDYLGLMKKDGRWVIVNKLFAHQDL
ncbi:nuclear transport factor 2 family protein [Fulvivirgaceae bacterium BMA10]|uniref:Nuclear transport factor 2 family protein n=1 Tax=Splendidivirga corallicola TaxID=3051826 RepID=A0ABT8KKF4_9BACT|nr:nuclear transport factor 2 family protein [Fulvivirgaceae bacterium BMA10]